MVMRPFGPPFMPHQGSWPPQAPQSMGGVVQWAPHLHAPPPPGSIQPPPPPPPRQQGQGQQQFAPHQYGKLSCPPHPSHIRQVPGGSEPYLSSQSGNYSSGDMSPHVPPQPSATMLFAVNQPLAGALRPLPPPNQVLAPPPSLAQQNGSVPPAEGPLQPRLNTSHPESAGVQGSQHSAMMFGASRPMAVAAVGSARAPAPTHTAKKPREPRMQTGKHPRQGTGSRRGGFGSGRLPGVYA